MQARMTGHVRDLMKVIKNNPKLQKILDKDPQAEVNPILHDHIKDPAFLVGFDFLQLTRETAKVIEGKKYDKNKIRRRVEEHLRKYAADQFIIGLALFLGIPVD